MKRIQKARRPRGSADGRGEPPAIELRDPDIVRAHRIARRRSRPGLAGYGRPPPPHPPARAVTGHDQLPGPADDAGHHTG